MPDMTVPTATPASPSSLDRLLGAEAYKLSPATLANKLTDGDWIPAKHLLYMSQKIAAAIRKGGARLIISIPTRHGKSELISHWTSVWALNRDPSTDIILASYGSELATDFGRKVRDTILDDGDPELGAHLLDVKLNRNSLNVSRFHTTEGGGMRSAGIGGAINGRGADLLLLDDYFKNPEEAMSETNRDKIFEWFSSVGMTRLAPGASVIIVATRWHKDDLSGRLLSMPNSSWEEIKLPIFARDDDVLGREKGGLLWPERYTPEAVAELQNTMSNYFFSAIMMQEPKESSSDSFVRTWLKEIPVAMNNTDFERVRSWDLAGTEDGGDWTVGTLIARDKATNNIYIEDMIRLQKAPGGVETMVEATMALDGPDVKVLIEQEPGSSGKAVAEGYISRNPEYSVTAILATGNKFLRMSPFFAAAEHGRIHMVKADWNEGLLDELIALPDGKHDDRSDTLSQAYNYLFKKRRSAGVFGETTPMISGNVISGVVF